VPPARMDCSELFSNYSFSGSFLHRMCAVYLNVVFGSLLRVGGSGRNILIMLFKPQMNTDISVKIRLYKLFTL